LLFRGRMTRKEFSLNGRTVRYYDDGAGPVVLLIHGAGATARLWHRQSGPLSRRFRVIAPDLPGFGGTERSPGIGSVRGFGRFIADFLDALGIARASVVGSSMGGWAACWFAHDHPEKISRLVLISPAGLYLKQDPPMPITEVIGEIEKIYSGVGFSAFVGVKPMDEMQRGVETIQDMYRAGGFTPDLAGRLGELKAPTLIIWGKEDNVIPVSYAREWGKEMPGSKVLVLDGAGHLPFVERPDEVNHILNDFLEPDIQTPAGD
jgi:pimeloyl-ACP methyl ester carboxylesterase